MIESVEILESLYSRKLKTNPNYSRRAFARDLKCSPSFLTNFMKGRRRLSVSRAEEMVALLKMDKRTGKRFVKSILIGNMQNASPGSGIRDLLNDASDIDVRDVELDQFQYFNGWYHVAILDLIALKDFQATSIWIAEKLGIQPAVAFAAVDRLKRLGLLKVEDGRLVKTNAHLRVPTQGINNIITNFHRQMIDKALKELDTTDPLRKEKRLVTGITMSVPSSQIPAAKEKIENFKREMAALMTGGEADEVVQLNIQLFPLTK